MKKIAVIKLLAGSLLSFSAASFACIGVQNNSESLVSVKFYPDDIGDIPVAAKSCVASGDANQIEQITEMKTNQKITAIPDTTVIYNGHWSGFVIGCCPSNVEGKNSLQVKRLQ